MFGNVHSGRSVAGALPEYSGSEPAAAARHELRQADQHSGRLRVPASAAVDGEMCRRRLFRKDWPMTEFRANAAMGKRIRGRAMVAKDGFSARYDLDRVNGVFSRP